MFFKEHNVLSVVAMRELDSDDKMLTYGGHSAERDIVQVCDSLSQLDIYFKGSWSCFLVGRVRGAEPVVWTAVMS